MRNRLSELIEERKGSFAKLRRRSRDPVRWLVVGAAGGAVDRVEILVVRNHKLKRRSLE